MITIVEDISNKLPNRTSLYFKLPFIDKNLEDLLKQQSIIYFDKVTNTYELPITRLYFIITILNKFDDVKYIPFKESIKSNIDLDVSNFKIKPYNYQIDGIKYGLQHNGWILLDDQGLGKTLQIIYLAEELKRRENIEHCLIICGVSSLRFNWVNEINKFSKLSYRILGQRYDKNNKLVIKPVIERLKELSEHLDEFFIITNIETLQHRDFSKYFDKSKKTNKFDMIILDEAHRAKSVRSHAAKALLKMQSKHNIALTGTILTNNPDNLYMPLKWTGNLKCCKSLFVDMYTIKGGFNNKQIIGYKNLELLQEHLKSCSLRRLKSEVLELPERTFSIEYVELNDSQRKLYDATANLLELNDISNNNIVNEMSNNIKLRQITAWPHIVSEDDIPSSKLDRLVELAEDIVAQGDKVLIYSTFVPTVYEIERRLKTYNPVVCTGDTSDADISNRKKLFQEDDDYKIMVATWQKMGTGHTLTAANYIIFIDTPWNDSDFIQACDRCYRIGQYKNTNVIILVAKDTYDERVLEILNTKKILSNYIVDKIDSDNLVQMNEV